MKNLSNILKTFACLSIAAVSLSGCSEKFMDDVNKDINHTTNVDAYIMLPDIELRTAQNIIAGDFNTYVGTYTEQWAGVHNQLWNAENRGNQTFAASTFNNGWADIYTNIRNCKIVIKKCTDNGSVADKADAFSLMQAKILLAYNAACLTDLFGDAPFSQTADKVGAPENPFPTIDKQSDIYSQVDKLLDEAIKILEEGGLTARDNGFDFIYKGDAAKWLKFAYGLKARYAMRRYNVSTDKKALMNDVLSYIDKSFKADTDQAALNVYDASNCNPVFDFEWSRDGIAASESLHKKLVARKDPRAGRAYFDGYWWAYVDPDSEAFNPAPNGKTEQAQQYYTYTYNFFAENAPVHFLGYDELLFLKAEAQVRNNQIENAKATLKEAVVAAMTLFEINIAAAEAAPTVNSYGGVEPPAGEPITKADAEKYFDDQVAPLFDKNKDSALKEVMIQKYLSMWNAQGGCVETYNDIRRIAKSDGIALYELANTGKFPVRLPYGTDDTSANENVKKAYGDGQYVFTEPVWWAGGTR